MSRLLSFMPPRQSWQRYWEPFVGAGSLFFALRPAEAMLSDLNSHLIACFEQVRDNPLAVARYLQSHVSRNSRAHYYEVRELYNRSRGGAAQAARFLYLNRTCFNGVFRVNRSGKFNVPVGRKDNPQFPSHDQLLRSSEALAAARLQVADYRDALKQALSTDLVYLDPPYPPLNGTANFTHYTKDRFSVEDHAAVAEVATELAMRGCNVIVTNADTPAIRSLYRDFVVCGVPATRYVTCKRTRHRVSELVITSYPTPIHGTEGMPDGHIEGPSPDR